MSFYGNVNNAVRTGFSFERTYANRKLMDASAATDGVYFGNYVLVNYDVALLADWSIIAYAYPDNDGNIVFWNYPEFEDETLAEPQRHALTYADVELSSYLYPNIVGTSRYKYIIVPATKTTTTTDGITTVIQYNFMPDADLTKQYIYEVITRTPNDDGTVPDLLKSVDVRLLTTETSENTYGYNYLIDTLTYQNARGYDGTVWLKVYSGNPARAHYVQIAELNSVVPTFDVVAEAPTLAPMTPHFDISSTNVYYKLHWLPSWGLRVKSAVNPWTRPVDRSTTTLYSLNFEDVKTILPSDETTKWSCPHIDASTNEVTQYKYIWKDTRDLGLKLMGQWSPAINLGYTDEIPAAIYYNKSGFDSLYSNHAEDIEDSILLTTTGLSSERYHTHMSPYVAWGSFSSYELYQNALSALRLLVAQTFPDAQVYNQLSGTYEDAYGRDLLYFKDNGNYVLFNIWDNETSPSLTLYRKPLNASVSSELSPLVDTQELSIMLPSVGNTIATVWDVLYGDKALNGTLLRNLAIDWLEGKTFHSDPGLRLVTTKPSGFGYERGATETVAGAINSIHDALGMLIVTRDRYKNISDEVNSNATLAEAITKYTEVFGKERGSNQYESVTEYVSGIDYFKHIDRAANEDDDSLKELSTAYIYYYPGEELFYRKEDVPEWGDALPNNLTPYNPFTTINNETVETKYTEPYYTPIQLTQWELDHTIVYKELNGQTIETQPYLYYYRENTLTPGSYNYLCEKEYHYGYAYFTLDRNPFLSEYTYETFGVYEPNKYYEYYTGVRNIDVGWIDFTTNSSGVIERHDYTSSVSVFKYSKDKTAISNHQYFDITEITPVEENYRLFEYAIRDNGENDISHTFYTASDWVELTGVTQAIYDNAPTRYFILLNGEYIRSSGYEAGVTYWTPLTFEPATSFDPSVNYYYTVEVKATLGSEAYISQVSYIAYTTMDEIIFNNSVCYELVDENYVLATEYDSSKTYYARELHWVLTTIPTVISADNATLVKCIDPNATVEYINGETRPRYYYYAKVDTDGKPAFYAITGTTRNGNKRPNIILDLPIVELTMEYKTGFYSPNSYYYRVTEGVFKDSWIVDPCPVPTRGRAYYELFPNEDEALSVDAISHPVDLTFYEPNKYSSKNNEIERSPIMELDGEHDYYKYYPLYVYSVGEGSDAEGILLVGDRWNMMVALNPNDNIELRQLIEKPLMILLRGFSRNQQTMNGSILYADKMFDTENIFGRKYTTFSGMLNNIYDIVNIFEDLEADKVLLSNKFGYLKTRGIVFNDSLTIPLNNNALMELDYYDPWTYLTNERSIDLSNWHIAVRHKNLANDQLLTRSADTSIHDKIWGYTAVTITETDYNNNPNRYYELIRGLYTKSTNYKNDTTYYILNAALTNGNTRTNVTIDNSQTQTPLFGLTFNVFSEFIRDVAGHVHDYKISTIKIPLPSLTEKMGLTSLSADILAEDSTWNDWNVMMGIELDPTAAAFTYRRHNVADLKLHDYINTDSSTDAVEVMNAGHLITANSTINEAFAALETYIWNSDVQDVFAPTANNNANKLDSGVTTANINNWYITNLTETDGRIDYSLSRLINTSNDVVLRSTDAVKGQTAVSAHAVRESINDLDVTDKCVPNATTTNTSIVNWYITNLSESDGLINYDFTLLINTSSDVVLNGVLGLTAVSGKAVRECINDLDYNTLFVATSTNNNEYITELHLTDGIISYLVTTLLNTNADITTTANGAVSGKGVRDVINSLDVADKCNSNINRYITELHETDGLIDYDFTTLINSSADIVNDGSDKSKTAVSGQAVRQAINDLDSEYYVTINDGEYLTGIEIRDGLIYPAVNTGSHTGKNAFETLLTDNTTSLIAPSSLAVVNYSKAEFLARAYTNKANRTSYIYELSLTDGTISYEVLALSTTLALVNDNVTGAYAVSGLAVRAAINDVFADLSSTVTNGTYFTGLTYTNNRLGFTTGNLISDIATNNSSTIAPTTAAVVNYISSTLTNWTGNTAITSVGTITTGTWNATNISTAKIGLANEILSTDLIPGLAASKITSGVFEAPLWLNAPVNTIPQTVTTNGVTNTTYPIYDEVMTEYSNRHIQSTDTLILIIAKLRERINDLIRWINEFKSINSNLNYPNDTTYLLSIDDDNTIVGEDIVYVDNVSLPAMGGGGG